MSTGSALRAQGKTIHLANGQSGELVFDMDALCQIEEKFGSLDAMRKALSFDKDAKGRTKTNKPVMGPIVHMLWLVYRDKDGSRYSLEQFRKALSIQALPDYMQALGEAMHEAFEGLESDDPQPPAETVEASSPGVSGITSEPSSYVGLIENSGA